MAAFMQANSLIFALASSIAVSLLSFAGLAVIILNNDITEKIILYLLAFSAGGLIGGAFLHLLPEAMSRARGMEQGFLYALAGFLLFFILEKFLFWRHCHKRECDIHTFTYLNLIGDAIHNFIDGIIIGVSYTVDVRFGITTTLAVVLHEIPQELGDIGVLIYGGMDKRNALLLNFISALPAVAGTITGFCYLRNDGVIISILLAVAAGGFIYIAACDLIPELHRQRDVKKALLSMGAFFAGIILMMLIKIIN